MTRPHGSELDAQAFAALALPDPDGSPLALRLARLEGGAAGFLCRDREAALASIALTVARPGQRVLVQRELAPASRAWFHAAHGLGIDSEPVDAHDPVKVADALARGARALVAQQLAEPSLRELDVPALAWHARVYGAVLCVDNTLLGARARRPLERGADLSVHADLRALCGREDAREALVVARTRELGERLGEVARALSALCPEDAARSEELALAASSYGLRVEHAQRSARGLAERLAKRDGVRVRYPGSGRELAIELAHEADAAAAYARLPPSWRAPGLAGGATRALHDACWLRVSTGLEHGEAVWDALGRALALGDA